MTFHTEHLWFGAVDSGWGSGALSLARQLSRLGLSSEISETEARFVILANVVTFGTLVINLPYIPLFWVADNQLWATTFPSFFALLGGGLWLRSRGWHRSATSFSLLVVLIWLGICVHLFGSSQLLHFFFPATLIAAYGLFPPSEEGSMWGVALLAAAAFIWVVPYAPATGPLNLSGYGDIVRAANVILFVLFLLFLGAYTRGVTLSAEARLAIEKERSERLLLNVLPLPVARRLKLGEKNIAESHGHVSVLFAKLERFNERFGEEQSAEAVRVLNEIFVRFDELVEERQLEKIKTVGASYMVAGGIPSEHPQHEEAVAQLALGMMQVIAELGSEEGEPLRLRIGLHVGPVVAGVIGKTKFSYDLWGDTVNTASRMESHGQGGTIQVTDEFRRALLPNFKFSQPRVLQVKGKGEMNVWNLLGPRSPEEEAHNV